MKIRIKTLEEFGDELPAYWVEGMRHLCGTVFNVKDDFFDDDEYTQIGEGIVDGWIKKQDVVILSDESNLTREEEIGSIDDIIKRTLELKSINDLHVSYREVELPVIFGDVQIWKKTLKKLFGEFPQRIKLSIKEE